MLLLAIAFWVFVVLCLIGIISWIVDVMKGKTHNSGNSLPEPLREFFNSSEGKTYNVRIDITSVKKENQEESKDHVEDVKKQMD